MGEGLGGKGIKPLVAYSGDTSRKGLGHLLMTQFEKETFEAVLGGGKGADRQAVLHEVAQQCRRIVGIAGKVHPQGPFIRF